MSTDFKVQLENIVFIAKDVGFGRGLKLPYVANEEQKLQSALVKFLSKYGKGTE